MCINICHQSILDYVETLKLSSAGIISNGNATSEQLEENFDLNSDFVPLKSVLDKWNKSGIASTQFSDYLKNIRENIVEKTLPTSLKHVSIVNDTYLNLVTLFVER